MSEKPILRAREIHTPNGSYYVLEQLQPSGRWSGICSGTYIAVRNAAEALVGAEVEGVVMAGDGRAHE